MGMPPFGLTQVRPIVDRGVMARSRRPTVARRGVQYYSAVISNSLASIPYANAPVGIRIEFDKGDVPTADYISVLNDSLTPISFQWEGDIDPHTEADVSLWPDGSLRAGTLWVNVPALAAGASLTYQVKTFDAAQGQSFAQSVTHVTVSGTVEQLRTTGQWYSFESGQNWQLRRIYDQALASEDYFTGATGLVANARINSVDKWSYNVGDVSGVTQALRKSTAFGYGVAFQEWEVNWTWAAETGMSSRMRYRVWANGTCDVELYTFTTGALASNARKILVQIQHQTSNGAVTTGDVLNCYTRVEWTTPTLKRLLLGAAVNINSFEATPNGSYTQLITFGASANWPSSGWGQNTTAAPSGAYWTQRCYISPAYALGDHGNEFLRRRNPVLCRASRFTLRDLKRQFTDLSSALTEMFIEQYVTSGDRSWKGCLAAAVLYDGLWNGKDKYDAAVTHWNDWVAFVGADGTAATWSSIWTAVGGFGIEYTGRNTMCLRLLRDEAIRTGRDPTPWETLIHNFADFYVAAEITSGGGGAMFLHNLAGTGNNIDIINAQAAALWGLANSLSLQANATRSATFGRMLSHFMAEIEANSFIPYVPTVGGQPALSVLNPTAHYPFFSMWYLQSAYLKLPGSMSSYYLTPRVFSLAATNALGQIFERQNQYNIGRRGSLSSQLFMAASLAMTPAQTISDMEHACALLRHIVSREVPGNLWEAPSDNWGSTAGVLGQGMDVQALCAASQALAASL